jgi:hypothetical protein
MSRGDDRLRIQHIIDAIDEAIQYMNGHTEACKTHHIPIHNIEKDPQTVEQLLSDQ